MEIRTERLLLRDFSDQDWIAVHSYQQDPAYLRYYEWIPPMLTKVTLATSCHRITGDVGSRPKRRRQCWAWDSESSVFIGSLHGALPFAILEHEWSSKNATP